MPDLSVSEAQLERLEEISEELETVYVGEYGTVRPTDALQYLLDTYTPPDDEGTAAPNADADADADADEDENEAADLDALTGIDGVGEATAESLAAAGFPTVTDVADADPNAVAELDGIGHEQAVDIVASAAAIGSDGGSAADSGAGAADDPDDGGSTAPSNDGSPENTLQEAMSLLDAHDDRWRESSGDAPYEVDLPDGSTEAVRTKDDIKRLIFKHWR